MMNNWKDWRRHQRAELMVARECIEEADHRRWSAVITALLEQGFLTLRTGTVGFCWPHRGEYDPRPLMDFLQAHGATLALPEVVNKHEPLCFRKWWWGAPMKIGAYNIPVPDNTDLVTVDALIIPMIGFDKLGFRLGYGSGYFDRTLAAMNPRPLAIGVAFEILRLENLHPHTHDIPMDFVVTEAGIYHATHTGLKPVSVGQCADILTRENSGDLRIVE